MRNSFRVSIKINMGICDMGINSSTTQQVIAHDKFLKMGESSLSKIHISHDTKTTIIVKFCTRFDRLMRVQIVSFSDNYYDKKFKFLGKLSPIGCHYFSFLT